MEDGPAAPEPVPEKGSTREHVRGALEATMLVLQGLRERYAADRAAGRLLSIGAYAALFPGYEDLVREEIRHIREEDPPVRLAASPFAIIQELLRSGLKDVDLSRELARGGMGIVYRVKDPILQRDLALKVAEGARVPVDGPTTISAGAALRRLIQEAQITAQLTHPGVVPVHDAGIDRQGRLFFTMKLVRGRTLRDVFDLLREGADGWTLARAVQVLHRICETMAYAHSKGVIHRDLKPANVMVGTFGEVYVMDWGVAKVIGDPAAEDHLSVAVASAAAEGDRPEPVPLTRAGDVVGTPEYMPPEQASGRLDLMDQRSDVYSLGAMLYELLSRRPPYDDPSTPRTPVGVLQSVMKGPPVSLSTAAEGAPPELQAICQKAMSRAPADRYPSAEAMAHDLRRFLEGRVVLAYRTGPLVELKSWIHRNRLVAGTVIAATVLLVAGAVLYAVERGNAAEVIGRERDSARNAEKRERSAHGRAVGLLLAARSADVAPREPALALQLAIEAARRAPGPESEDALQASLAVHLERRRLVGHDGYVVDGSWSPDGRFLLTREWGGAAILWETATGRVIARLLADAEIRDAILSPDGRTAAIASDDGTLRLFGGTRGEPGAILRGAPGPVTATAFAAGRALVASGSADGSIRLWPLPDGRGEKVLRAAGKGIEDLEFSPDGSRLVAMDGDGTGFLFDTDSGRLLREIELASLGMEPREEHSAAHVASFAAGGKMLVTWDTPGILRLLSVEGNGIRVLAERRRTERPTVSGDGSRVAVVRREGESGAVLEVFDAADPANPRVVPVPRMAVWVALDRRGRRAAMPSASEVELWDIEAGSRYALLRGHRYDLKGGAFAPDDGRFATFSADMTARIRESEPPDAVRLPAEAEAATQSADGTRWLRIGAPGGDGVPVSVVETVTGRVLRSFVLPQPLRTVQWFADGAGILSVSGDRAFLQVAATGASLGEAAVPAGTKVVRPWLVSVDRDNSRIAFKDADEQILVADLKSPAARRVGDGAVWWALSPDGKRLLCGEGRRATGRIFDVESGAVLQALTGHTGYVVKVAWSPDGLRVATAAVEGRVRIWDPDTGEQVAVVSPVPMRGNPVTFGDGHRRLFVTADQEVLICDGDTGRRISTLRPGGVVNQVAATPDGQGVFVAWGTPTVVRRWPVDPLPPAVARVPMEAEPSVLKANELLDGDALDAYEVRWLRDHPTARGHAVRAIAEARKGRVDEALRWVDAARILRPRLGDVEWAEACVRGRRCDSLPAGPARDEERTRGLAALERAIALTDNVRDRATKEPLLASLRDDPRFTALVGK